MFIGTTSVAINRASAALTLAGITLTTPDIGTPSAGTLTNCTGLPIAGLAASTSTAIGVGSIELGHASDTSITRVSAGVIAVEGVNVVLSTVTSLGSLTTAAVLPWTGMKPGTDGEIPTFDASGNPAFVAVGTATHVLTSNGPGAAPTFQAAAGGGNKLGSTQLTEAAATITLSSLTAKERMKFMVGIVTAPASEIRLQFNGDTGNNYAWRVIENGGTVNTGTNATYISLTDTGNTPATNSSVIIEIEVINYASADKAVHAMGTFTGAATDATAPGGFWSTGHWDDSTNAITSITISNAAASNFGIGSYIIAYGDDA